ncbi:MAG: hypothetical protein ACTS3R_19155 [Inquilinaceae bacterium]
MHFGQLLVAQGLIGPEDVQRATQVQREHGGRLADNLVALGVVRAEQMAPILARLPATPRSLEETGVGVTQLLRLLLKAISIDGLETQSQLSDRLKLSANLIGVLIQDATEKRLLETLAPSSLLASAEPRFALTGLGREWAAEALAQNQYVGPAPVSLSSYGDQIRRQRMAEERVDRPTIQQAFAGMVIPDHLVRKLGPAINSANSILLYGSPGNGKTSIAERMGRIFSDIIYIPYCIEVEGQIIKLFDPSVHDSVVADTEESPSGNIRQEQIDGRWVPCRRPVIITGGELTLEMLDLKFDSDAKFYEAPLHLKALNGTFIIDDFGRQLVRPTELLNRWIVPLESRVDFLKLHTGKSFEVPFDEMVIFSTNMEPDDLMDAAFLRRIPYKLEIPNPSPSDYRLIFSAIAKARGLDLADDMFAYVVDQLQTKNNQPLACYQPKFIVEQVIAASKFEGTEPRLSQELIAEALSNLYTRTASNGATAAVAR